MSNENGSDSPYSYASSLPNNDDTMVTTSDELFDTFDGDTSVYQYLANSSTDLQGLDRPSISNVTLSCGEILIASSSHWNVGGNFPYQDATVRTIGNDDSNINNRQMEFTDTTIPVDFFSLETGVIDPSLISSDYDGFTDASAAIPINNNNNGGLAISDALKSCRDSTDTYPNSFLDDSTDNYLDQDGNTPFGSIQHQYSSLPLQFSATNFSNPIDRNQSLVNFNNTFNTSSAVAAYASTINRLKKKRGRKIDVENGFGSIDGIGTTGLRQNEIAKCSNCSVRETPAWRRDLKGAALLCNACGLYLKNKGVHRPTEVAPDGTIRLMRGQRRDSDVVCHNCGGRNLPCWKGPSGQTLCAKCGIFQRQNGYPRPPSPSQIGALIPRKSPSQIFSPY